MKQSLSQLRVEEEWLADRSRIFREMESLIDVAVLLPAGSVSKVLWSDRDNYLFAMTAISGHSWKDELMAGKLDTAVASTAGTLLGRLIRQTWESEALQRKYGDLRCFEQLRIDPYYRTVAARHPEVGDKVLGLIEEMTHQKTCLVHGDFSPKNILTEGDRVTLIDFEVVHFGDPAFDAAFCLSLLLVGWFYHPELRRQREQTARAFLNAVRPELPTQARSSFERRVVRHLGCLMLARIDGKSPVEYLSEESTRNQVRQIAVELILRFPDTLEECMERTFRPQDSTPPAASEEPFR